MWLSKYGDVKARGLYPEIKSYLEQGNVKSLDFAETCAEECDNYIELLEISRTLPKESYINVEGLIKYLGITSCIPLLLSGKKCLNDSDFAKLAKMICSLVVRYLVITNQNPLLLESAFYAAARDLRVHHANRESSDKCLMAVKSILQKLNPPDATVEDAAKDLRLSRRPAVWLMMRLASAMQTNTKEVGVDEANLEHIFPQNATLADWPNLTDLEELVWHIGNLTVLGNRLNNKARNKGFIEKRDDHYAVSEIQMTKDLLKYPEWTYRQINSRAATLAKKIVQVWT